MKGKQRFMNCYIGILAALTSPTDRQFLLIKQKPEAVLHK